MSFVVPSRNAKLENYEILRNSDAYRSREMLLKDLFRKYGTAATQMEIYEALQEIDESVHVKLHREKFEALEKLAASMPDRWERFSSYTSYDYWWKFSAECANSSVPQLSDLALIKVYVSVNDIAQIPEMYDEAVRLLLENSDNRFYSKVSTVKRSDCMCFWVSRHAFDVLEDFFKNSRDIVSGALPFVAYRGNLGISRELASWDSYNAQQAQLISSYFHSLKEDAAVDMGEMYQLLVKAWNREEPQDHPVMEAFRYSKAQTILIMLDTMDVITGRTVIDDHHLLLQDDNCLWRTLGDVSRDEWDQVEQHYQKNLQWEERRANM